MWGWSVLPIRRSNERLALRRFFPSELAKRFTKSSTLLFYRLHRRLCKWLRDRCHPVTRVRRPPDFPSIDRVDVLFDGEQGHRVIEVHVAWIVADQAHPVMTW